MSLFDEEALRTIIGDEIAKAIRREIGAGHLGGVRLGEYLPVVEAAAIAAVSPATIRAWMDDGRLARYHAGRELRVRRSELEALLRSPPTTPRGAESSPEAEADRLLLRRQLRAQVGRRG